MPPMVFQTAVIDARATAYASQHFVKFIAQPTGTAIVYKYNMVLIGPS